jgi:hypothetical protein
MAGLDDGFSGEARLTPGFTVGYLSQEPELDPTKDVLGNVADGVADVPYDAGQVRLASDYTDLGTNYMSSYATDFRSLIALGDDDTYSPFTSITATEQTGPRTAIASATNFVMFGRTERVEMTHSNVTQAFSWVRRTLTYATNGVPTATNVSTITSNFTARVLARVRELQIGEPYLATSNSVSIAVRLVDHATPYVGGGSTYVNGAVLEAALEAVKGKVEDKQGFMKALRSVKAFTARGPVSFDPLGNVVGDVFIRRVERKEGRLVNTVQHTYPNVSQFWTYNQAEFLKNPVYSRDFPPARNLES